MILYKKLNLLDLIAKNVENEINKSNDIYVERSSSRDNTISDVLNIEPINIPEIRNKFHESKNTLKDEDGENLNEKNNLKENLVNQDAEEYLSAESDTEGIEVTDLMCFI